jgi:hypothetical protein
VSWRKAGFGHALSGGSHWGGGGRGVVGFSCWSGLSLAPPSMIVLERHHRDRDHHDHHHDHHHPPHLSVPRRVYSNAEEVELFLNGASLGKQAMPVEEGTDYRCRHVEWKVRLIAAQEGVRNDQAIMGRKSRINKLARSSSLST